MKKIIFFLIDGLADEIKNDKTPLKEAVKENINQLAKKSLIGELKIFDKWNEAYSKSVSHLALLKIFGYDLEIGRGVLEAIGNEMNFENGNLALRGNFATVSNNIVVDRRAGRNVYLLDNLIEEIKQKIKLSFDFEIRRGYAHRISFLLKGQHSKNISSNDVKVGSKIEKILPLDKNSIITAKVLQEFVEKSFEILDKSRFNLEREKNGILKANYIMLRDGENYLPKIKKHFNKKCLAIVENSSMKGVCIISGFNILTIPEITENYQINHFKTIDFIFEKILENFENYDLIFSHIKAMDEAAHDKNFELKKTFIEYFDKKLSELINENKIKIVITCDHITSSIDGTHKLGNVPILIYGLKKVNRLKTFDEIQAKKSNIEISPKKLWNLLGWKLK